MKLPHVNKKALARKRKFVQTPFSHSALNLGPKNLTPHKQSLFRSNSCFGVTTPICLQQILKKDSAPIQFEFFEL